MKPIDLRTDEERRARLDQMIADFQAAKRQQDRHRATGMLRDSQGGHTIKRLEKPPARIH